MDEEARAQLVSLLQEQRVLSLSVLVDQEPYVGLLPFVSTADHGGSLIHVSGLARHSKGLGPGRPVAALIHQPDRPELDPMQLVRVSLEGTAEPLERDGAAYAAARERYQQRFPASEMTFGLGDFQLYELRWSRGRLVAGFGRAFNLSRDTLLRLNAEG